MNVWASGSEGQAEEAEAGRREEEDGRQRKDERRVHMGVMTVAIP